jgi:transposase
MRESMEIYPRTAAERAMKLQEVLLRATSGKIKWWQAAELIGISERQMRRWRKRYEEQGYQGLLDRRRRKPSSRRVPKEQAEAVLSLYRDRYFDLNVRHFHEKLGEEHQIGLSYTWVKQALQGSRPGEAQGQARRASQAARATSSARDDAAHRRQRTSDGFRMSVSTT